MNNNLGNKQIMAKNILKYMERDGKSRHEVCHDLGISYTTFTDWVKGKTYPRIDKIELLANYFRINKADLVEDHPIPSFPNITPIARKTFPLFDGIAAGESRLMPDGVTLYVDATVDVQADYVLKVHGDSMIGARINDGDYVFIRQQPEVENGEIAAVAIGDEATLKRFYKYGDVVVLRGENPEFKELTFSGEQLAQVRILGKAVAFQSDVR